MDSLSREQSALAASMIRGVTSWIALLSGLAEDERSQVAIRILHLITPAMASQDQVKNRLSHDLDDWLKQIQPNLGDTSMNGVFTTRTGS